MKCGGIQRRFVRGLRMHAIFRTLSATWSTSEAGSLRALRLSCRRKGFRLPSGCSLTTSYGVPRLVHRHCYTRIATDADGRPNEDSLLKAAIALRHRVDLQTAFETASRKSSGGVATPAPLVHPIALWMMKAAQDMPHLAPPAWQEGSLGRVHDFHYRMTGYGTCEYTRIMIMRRDDPGKANAVFSFLDTTDGETTAQFAVTHIVPEAAAMRMAGTRLLDHVSIDAGDDHRLAQALNGVIVRLAEAGNTSTIFTLEPVRWIPYDQSAADPAWDDREPHFA